MKFKYWNNKEKAHGELILEVIADNILDADMILRIQKRLDPVKCPWIGCEVIPLTDDPKSV